MQYAGGFLKVPREVLAAIGPDPITRGVYLEILSRARWEAPVKRTTSHGVVELDIGQCYLGRAELAEAVGTSEQRVRTAIRRLETLAILTVESTKRGTVATLCGYKESTTPPTSGQRSEQPSSNQASTTTKIQTPDLDLSLSDPLREPPGDPGSARLGPKSAALADPCLPGDGAHHAQLLTELLRGGTNLVLLKGGGS